MPTCYLDSWNCGLGAFGVIVTGALAGVMIYFGVQNLNAEGMDTREGRIEHYCDAVQAWEDGGAATLDGHSFTLRNADTSLELDCTLSSSRRPSMPDLGSDVPCSNSLEKRVVCAGLGAIIPSPAVDATYSLELFVSGPSGSSRIGSLSLRAALLAVRDPPRGTRNGQTQNEKDRVQRENCEEANGEPLQRPPEGIVQNLVGGGAIACRLLFRLAPTASGRGPCYVMDKSAGGGFEWADSMWPDAGIADASSRAHCLKPQADWNVEPGMVLVGPPSAEQYSQPALASVLAAASIELRLQGDPLIVASAMTESTFDFGLSAGSRMAVAITLLVFGSCCSCCCLGSFGYGVAYGLVTI